MSNAETEIRTLEAQRYAAMLAADIPALQALLSERLVYVHSNATMDGKASYIERVRDNYFDYLDIEHHEEQVLFAGDCALVFGHMSGRVLMERKLERHLNNRTLAIWAREDGVWRFLAFQPTPIP